MCELVDGDTSDLTLERGHFILLCPGHQDFPGERLHSRDYRDPEAYRGKRVLVVGIGNSGGDIAVEISRCAEMVEKRSFSLFLIVLFKCLLLFALWQTFLSTRRGAWVISRMSRQGLPVDISSITRFNQVLMELLPRSLLNGLLERALNQKYDHRLYGLQPHHRYQCRTLPEIIASWAVFH